MIEPTHELLEAARIVGLGLAAAGVVILLDVFLSSGAELHPGAVPVLRPATTCAGDHCSDEGLRVRYPYGTVFYCSHHDLWTIESV